MEPEDLPWPGELEEEEEEAGEEEEEVQEEEVQEEKEEVEEPENLDEDEVVTVEDEEVEERRELDADFNYESQLLESTDDEEDEEAKAWLQAHPGGTLPPTSLPKHRYSEIEPAGPEKVVPLTSHVWQQSYQDKNRTPISDSNVVSLEETAQWDSEDDQKTESWHFLPQEIDSSHTLDTTQTRFKVREEGTEMTDFPSVEEGILTQSENQVKEPNRDLFCSSLLVIQDNFASPDLPLLTCLTQDQEFGLDSLFHQSELDFVPLRAIPGKSEDTEWFSRPSEVSEALLQAASGVASDIVNSHFSVSQHTLIGSTALESQGSILYPEQGTKEETVSSGAIGKLKTPKDSDSYDALCSCMSWKRQEVTQEPETTLANKDQLSFSTSSDTSEEEYVTPKEKDSFDASCLYVQYWKQEALQQSEKYLTNKDHDSCSDSSDTIDKNKISEGIGNFSVPLSYMPWSELGASHHPETCAVSKDHVSFPPEVASHKMSYSFLHCLLEGRRKSAPFMSDSHYLERVYLRASTENEVKQKMVSLEGYERNEEGLGKELSQSFELKENSNTVVFLKLCPSSSEVQYVENVVVPDNSVKVSETHTLSREHDISKVETSGGPLQTITSTLDETSEQLYFQEERNQKASAAFGGKNVNATENVAFEAVIASIEPSKKENTGNEIQTDITKSLTNYRQDSEPKNSDLFLLNYNDVNSFFDKFSHPHCRSIPGVFEPAASKPLLHKKDDDVSSLYWHTNAELLPSAPQEMFIRPLSSASLSEKSHSQVVGLCKTQSPLFHCDIDNEPFLPIAEKAGSSNIIYPLKVSTSDSLFLQDLKQQTFEEVADSSDYILGKNVNSSHVIEHPSAAVGSSFSANLVAYDAKSQGALPMTSDASLIAVGQETLLKANTGLGEIPRPMGAKSSFTVHTIIQNDSYFVEGLQGKSESDICTLGDDTECCSLDENAVVCSKRSAELQREMCYQGDLSGECIEVACLENMLDDLEICDSSLSWQSALQPPKKESSFEEPVGHSDMDINQSFASVLPLFVPQEPDGELEYQSSDLRMLGVSPEIVAKTLRHLSGDISEGSITEITQSNLKAGITTTSGDSDIGSYLPLTPEDFPQLVVRSSVENTLHLHADSLNKQILADGHLPEEALKVLAIPEVSDQKAGTSTLPSSSYSLREKPSIFYPQPLRDSQTEGTLTVSGIPGPTDQKTSPSTIPPSSYLPGEKHSIFYQQALPDSDQTEEAPEVSAVLGPADQKSEKTTLPSSSFSHRVKHIVFSPQLLPGSHLTEQAPKVSATAGPADQVTMIPTVSSTLYSHTEKPHIFFQQTLPESHVREQSQQAAAVSVFTDQKTRIPTGTSASYSHGEKATIFYQQELRGTHLPEQSQQAAAVSVFTDQKTGIPTGTSTSFSHGETPLTLQQQTLPGSHLPEQALKVSAAPGSTEQKTGIPTVSSTYSHKENPSLFYQQKLPESHVHEQSQQAAAVSRFADQKTGIPTGTSASYSHGEKATIFYQQELRGSHLPEQSQQAAAVSVFTDQKTGIPTGTSTSFSHGETPLTLQQQTLPGSHLPEQALKVSAAPGSTEQKTEIPTGTSTSYSHGEKATIFYQQELRGSHLPEQSQQAAAVSVFNDQKTGIPTGTSTSFSHGETPLTLQQQTLPGSHLPEQALKVSAAPGSTEQKTEIPTGTSTYSHRENPSLFYQQKLPESHVREQSQQAAAVSVFTDQKTGIPTGTSASYSHGEKATIFYQQELRGSHLPEQSQQAAAVSVFTDQKTGIPTGTSTSFSRGETPLTLQQQTLPGSHLPEQALKVSAAPGSTEQKTGIPTVSSTYSHRENPSLFYQQKLPESHVREQSQQAAAVSVFTDQKTGIPTGTSASYSHGEKATIFYQQELRGSHLPDEQSQQAAAVSVFTDQKTGIPTGTSTSFSRGETPLTLQQQTLPGSHLPEQALKVSAAPGSTEQKTGIPTVSSTYSHRENPSLFYQQKLPESHVREQSQQAAAVSRFADQKTGIPTGTSTSYSHGEKATIFYQQELRDSHLPDEQSEQAAAVSVFTDQKTGIPTGTSASYSHGEKATIFYQQELRGSHLPDEQSQQAAAVSVFTDQKTGIPTGTSTSFSRGETPLTLQQQTLPGSHLPEQALKVSAAPGSTEQKTGIPTVSSTYSHRENPSLFYQQKLPESHVREQSQQAAAVSRFADQKTGIPTGTSTSYSHGEKATIFYQQELRGSHLPDEQSQQAAAVSVFTDQKTGIPTGTSASYSHGEKATIFYQQELKGSHLPDEQSEQAAAVSVFTDQKTGIPTGTSTSFSRGETPLTLQQQTLPGSHLPEQALKVSAAPGSTEQKTGIPTVSSTYSHRENPSLFYQQKLPESHVREQSQQAAAVSGSADQKTGIPTGTSTSYSHGEKATIFYQQELRDSHLSEQSEQAAAVSVFTDQKTEKPTGTSTSFSHGEIPHIFYQQTLPGNHLIEQALKFSAPTGLVDQRSGTPTVSSTSYSHTEKPHIIYQQELPVSHLTKEAQKVPAVPGPAQQKTGIPVIPPTSYLHRGKTIFFSQQEFPDSHQSNEVLKVSSVWGPAEQNTGIPSGSSGSYSFEEKPSVFYKQTLPDSHLTEESLKVSSVLGDQKTGILTVPSSSNSHREKPSISYQQELPDSHLIEQAQKVSALPRPAEQKTGTPTITSTYFHREKPFIFNTQGLPDSHLPEESPKVTAIPELADQKAGLPSQPSGSYSHREKPIIFYPQGLPDTHLTEEALKVPTISGPADQKTGIPTVPSTSYPRGEKHIFISPQALPDSHLHEEALKVSPVSRSADQKIGLPTEPSGSYSHGEKPIIFYPQGLTESHLPEEALKVIAVPEPGDQKIGIPSELSGSYSHREKPIIFYPQGLTESHLLEEALKVSGVPGTGDQKTGIPTVPTSAYLVGGKSINFYQQALPDRHITEEALNVSASPEPAEQKTGLPTVSSTSYSQREKSFIFYPQALPDSQLTEEALTISAVPLPGDQNTRKPTAISNSYSHTEKPIISYQQELPGSHLTEEALKGSGVPGTADQKTGIPAVPSNSYSYREKPNISYKQDLTQEVLKVLGGSRPAGQETGIPVVTSTSYSHEEKPIISYQQELPDHNEDALKILVVPGLADQKTGIRIVPSSSYSHREVPISSYQKELPDFTEETLEVSTVAGPTEQKTGIQIIPSGSYSYREKGGTFYHHELPDTTEEALKVFVLPVLAGQKTEISAGPSSSYLLEEKPKISTVVLPDDQKTELSTASSPSYSHREKPKNLTVIGPDDQKTPLLTVFRNSYSQRVKPSIFFKQHLPGGHHSEDIVKASSVPEPTDVNSEIPISSSYSNREKSNILSAQELPEKHLTEDVLKVSTILEPDNQKTVLPTASPHFFPHREKPDIFYQQDLPDRHLTEDSPKFLSGLGQADENTGLSTGHSGTYSHSEKHKLVSDHVQRLIDNLDSSNSSIISNNMPLNSRGDYRVVVNKTEPSGFEDISPEEIQYTDNSSKTLKQIQTLLMEAENIALKRCNFPAPLVPFRDVSDVSFIQSKKVVCFKEPCTPDESNVDLPLRKPFTEENPSSKYIQKDNTETNLKCQRGIENWEFISSTTVRSPIQEAESKTRVALDETLRQYKAARSVMRSEPEGCSGTFGNKILIPMMTIIKSDSSSDASSCSWDSNSLESVSDVLLNLFPYASQKTSMTDSREEECVSESDDGGGSSVDSLAAHVKNLLKCESSLNHAKQILRNAEEEECRVRARAWNLKFNMAHECSYSISELNEDDRRKVEEIKAKLFGQDDLSKGLQSPRGVGCKPEALCSHVIIESHEKGCFRTLSSKQPQLDSHPCVFRSAEPLEIIRRQRSPLSWRPRHINLSRSLDQSNPHFKVWNSLQLQSHSPFQNFTGDDFRISKDFRMPFREKMNPWLSELVEPNCLPPEEMDCHSSSQMLPPESMKKFTSITFSSHRHSKCFSDSSVLKVGVTEDSQCSGASVGVFNSHSTEEQSPPRDLKQKTSSPSLFKIISHSPDKAVTILAESSSQGQKLSVEHSHQEEKLLEKPDFKGSHSEPSTNTNCSKFKEVHFSDNHTLISMGRPSSTLGVEEKNVTLTPNPPPRIFLEQQELFEQSKAPHSDHYVRKHHSPPSQHQHYVIPNLPCHIFLENRELLEQSKTPHVDHQMREHHSPLPQGEDYTASDLPSSIFLEQRQLFEQSKAPDTDHHIKKQYSPLPQGQDCVVENSGQYKPKSHISNINVETKVNNVVSQSAPNQRTLVISPASTPPSNRKALSCVHITISPKTSSNLDSRALNKRFLSLDPASKTRMNSEFNPDPQTISSRSLGPTSKLLTSKPVAHDQESLGFLGPKSSRDFQVKQSLQDGSTVTKDVKTRPFQNSQIVTSRQTQVNFSDLEEYSNPEGISLSADRSLEIKPAFSAFSGKLSSDAVTQITTESPGKAMFSSEIFINSEDRGHEMSKPSSQKVDKVAVRFASPSSVPQITIPDGTNGAQPSLLPYKPSGSVKMYYVPHLSHIPSSLDSTSNTTIESSHSGSNDAIAPHFPAQVLGTRDDDLALPVNMKHKEGIYSKRAAAKTSSLVGQKPFQKDNADAQVQVLISEDENLSDKNKKKGIYNKKAVTKPAQSEEMDILQKDTADSSDAVAAKLSAQLQDTKIERLPDTKAIKQKEEIHSKRTFPKEAWTEDKESLQINIEESRCHSEFENTTHSVFRSAKFYFHHPVHLPSDQDFCHESLGKSVFMRHSWKDFFHHHPDKQHTCLPPPSQNEEKTKTDYTRIESVSINVNKEVMHPTKSQARDSVKCDKQINDQKKDLQVTPEPTAQHITSLNELWNKYQERQKQQKPPGFSDRKEVSLVERLDRLAKLLQHPITHSLRPLDSTQDDSREQQDAKECRGRQQQQKNKLQKKKRYKSLEKCYKNIGDLKKSKVLSTHEAGGSNQIKIEQVKFDKYILRKQPDFHYMNSTSSDSRPSEDSELLTDTATNILSTTTSPVESDILTQTDKEMILHERSSSTSTIDTARLIQAFGHERVCLSPRRIKLYSSMTDHQRRYIEKRTKNKKKALSTSYPQMTSEHTRRKRIQVTNHMISSDSISSSTGSFWSSNSTLCNRQNVHMLNKGVQAGNLEIVNGVRKHTRDVGVIFPTPSSSEVRVEEDSDVTTWSEGKIEEKRLITSYLGDKKLRKTKQSCSEGVSWFVPVENVKSGPKKENLLKHRGPGISWFAPITNVKPWREPLREHNWQGQHTDSHGSLAGPGRGPLKPFVRATLQESLQLHRPDFISRSGERIKRLKLIVQERKLQNMFQSEREALFNTVREWQGHRDPMRPLPKRGFLAAQKGRPIGKKEMIQRSKRIYEQLPEVQKKREEEKRRLEHKSYRLRAQLYKKKVTNRLLGRKVPWD